VKLIETEIVGAWVIEPEWHEDERGSFARTFDRQEWLARGMNPEIVQCDVSHNSWAGTLRGMHYQEEPHGESKLVRCPRGSMYDAAIDLRPTSSTYGRWFGVELSAENGRSLYLPPGLAHGFQTLVDDTEVLYMMGHEHVPSSGRGLRWDDPAFGVEWPDPPAHGRTLSERDANYPDFAPTGVR
jgi:dTDP-4-dehydrorhamnose 3,5-epimerase